MTVAVISAVLRRLLEPDLPEWLDVRWCETPEDLLRHAPEAEIGWFDRYGMEGVFDAAVRAERLVWLNTIVAGIDMFPAKVLRARGTVMTNGAGLNAITIAEYVVMGMLTVAKGYRQVVRAQDRHEWLEESPGVVELAGTRALVIGSGGIGGRVASLLRAFEVDVTTVRRHPGPADLGPDDWRPLLGSFDWIVLAVPATGDTERLIGADELAAMKRQASIINIARGSVIDQPALADALRERRIRAAFLDVTTPEPLPADHELWSIDNAHITMHLSGRSQTALFKRGAALFLENLKRWRAGEPLRNAVDFAAGY